MRIKKLTNKVISFFFELSKNKCFIYGLTILASFICLFWYLERMSNAYYTSDDILDYIIEPYRFWHGRIISETIAVLLIKEIPNFFGININDFAIFAKGVFPGVTLIVSAFLLTAIGAKKIEKDISFPIAFIFIFFLIYFLIIKNGDALITVLAFFFGYVFPIPFFIIHWNKIVNLYISEEKATRKDYAILILTSLFLSQANEMMLVINTIIFGFIAVESIIKHLKKQYNNLGWSYVPLFWMIGIAVSIHLLPGSKDMQSIYFQFDSSLLSIEKFWFYFQHCISELIVDNIFFLTIIAFSLLIIFILKDKTKARKIFKIVCYTMSALFLFFLSLYFLNDSCHYADSIKDNIPSWWFLYFSLVTQLEIILLLIMTFLAQVIMSKIEARKYFYILSVFLWVCSIAIMKKNEQYFKDHYYKKSDFVHLYKMDKIALHSFQSQPYIYVIAEKMDNYYAIDEGNETMPMDLKTKKYHNKKYYMTHDGQKRLPYLEYLEEVYSIEADKKIIFDTEKNLIKKFKKDGLAFSKQEIEEPSFEDLEDINTDDN